MAFFLLSSRFAHHSVSLAKHSEFSSRNCLHVCVCKSTHPHAHTYIHTVYCISKIYILYIYLYKYKEHFPPATPRDMFLSVWFFFLLYTENRAFQNFYRHFRKRVLISRPLGAATPVAPVPEAPGSGRRPRRSYIPPVHLDPLPLSTCFPRMNR